MKKKKKVNPIERTIRGACKTIAIGALMNVSGQLTKPLIDKFCMLLKDNALYAVSIKYETFRIQNGLMKYFKHLPKRVDFPADDVSEIDIKPAINQIPEDFFEVIWWYGVPIAFMSTAGDTQNGRRDNQKFKLYTLNNRHCKEVLMDFLYELREEHQRVDLNTKPSIIVVDDCTNNHEVVTQSRTFDNVFIPTDDRIRIQNALTHYLNGRDFYEDNKLPNHFGILLYGTPGTAKSSLAVAIANYVNASPMVCMTGDQLKYLPDILTRVIWCKPTSPYKYRILLIEDIDSWMFSKDRTVEYENSDDEESKKKDVGLATILNCLDGIGAPTNVIYIFTTNHVEMLDPALIRPGRIDLMVEMKTAVPETLEQFLKFHYPNTSIPAITSVRDGITFAELQTKVLQGYGVEDIIAYCNNNVSD